MKYAEIYILHIFISYYRAKSSPVGHFNWVLIKKNVLLETSLIYPH